MAVTYLFLEVPFDLVVRGGTVVTPSGTSVTDVGVREGRIAALGDLGGAPATATIEARGLHVLPGVIDTQVHFREPGMVHKEDLATGTTAAILGGVTSILEMPNTEPPTTSAEALAGKLGAARGRARCDHAFFVGASGDNLEDLDDLEVLAGCAGVKVFMGSSTGRLLVDDDERLARVLASGRRRVAVHAEDEPRLRERRHLAAEAGHPRAHPEWRDAECALTATWRILALARRFGRPIHVLHVSTAEEMDVLALCKDIATVEVTPMHLTLEAPECYERLGTLAQMNPPVRDARHREALWEAVRAGLVDAIGSDHAPHTTDEKRRPYPQSPSGAPGVQTLLPIMLDHVAQQRLTLERVVDLTATGPARVYGIAGKGRIAVGLDADLALVDLSAQRTIRNGEQASRCGWTPYDGMKVTGWPVATVLRGHVVMRDGQVLGEPHGRPLAFVDALPGAAPVVA
jgi:dihydroorotase